MSQHFDQNTLNTAVFEPLCSGFSDSSSALRELTLKATLSLVPHLTHPNLEKLSRYLVRLQGDEEASIRTNTVIFFSKLAPHLTDMTRQKMLLPAFVRAMKDPFTPCRLAALKSCLKAKEFFDPPGIASRVLPAITPQLLDASAEVRKEAFQAVDELLFVLRQESERLNSLPEPGSTEGSGVAGQANGTATGKKTTAPPPAPSSAGGGWGLTSYFSKGSQSEAPKSAPAPARPPAPKPATPPRPVVPAVRPVAAAPVIPPPAPAAQMANMNFDDDWNDSAGDGWDEDDLLDLSSAAKKPLQFAGGKAPAPAVSSLLAPAAEDDFFGSFDVKPAKPAGMKKMGTGKLTVPVAKKGSPKSKKKPVAVKKITSDDDFGWDDF
jgi:SCY1-like protein 1